MTFEIVGLNEDISFTETESGSIIPEDSDPSEFNQALCNFYLEIDQFTKIRFNAGVISFQNRDGVSPIYKASRLFYVENDPRDWDIVGRLSEWQLDGLKLDFVSGNNRRSEARLNRVAFVTRNTLVFNYFESPDRSTGLFSSPAGIPVDENTFPILIARDDFTWTAFPSDREGSSPLALLISGAITALKEAKFKFSLERPQPVVPDQIKDFIDKLKIDQE